MRIAMMLLTAGLAASQASAKSAPSASALKVATLAQLEAALLAAGGDPAANIVLTRDIDAAGATLTTDLAPMLAGHLDGRGHVLSNLPVPLFEQIAPSGVVQNLTLTASTPLGPGASWSGSSPWTGAIARTNQGLIRDCAVVEER
jgi:hypothetical protein